MRFRPHSIVPKHETVRLIIAYKNFAAHRGISHIGLGVSALNNARVLRKAGFWVDVWPILSARELEQRVDQEQPAAHRDRKVPISHVVISAPWIATAELAQMVHRHTEIEWAVCSHSNVGFLQADPRGIEYLRQDGDLAEAAVNFTLATNSLRLRTWWNQAYHQAMTLIPNLYDVDDHFPHHRPWTPGTLLKMGSFGAIRPLKNQIAAAGAAVEIANRLRAESEFWMNSGRTEGNGSSALAAVRAILSGLHNIRLREAAWQPWPAFRAQVRAMHLLLQASYTESFNMVTADGVAEGVPSVTSDAIDWVPARWQAPVDDVNAIASTGVALLHDPSAAADGLRHLQDHNRDGLARWTEFLVGGQRA